MAYVKVTMEEHVRDTQNMGKDEIIISSLNSWPILTLKLWEHCVYLFQISSMLSVFQSSKPILILYTVVLLNYWFYYNVLFLLITFSCMTIYLYVYLFVHSIFIQVFVPLVPYLSWFQRPRQLNKFIKPSALCEVYACTLSELFIQNECSYFSRVLTCCCSL